jgi:hypothetical protein
MEDAISIIEAARKRRFFRSPLCRWVAENWDMISQAGELSAKVLAAQLAKNGIMDANGHPASLHSVANAILRERAHRKTEAVKLAVPRGQAVREDERGSAPVFKTLGKKGE